MRFLLALGIVLCLGPGIVAAPLVPPTPTAPLAHPAAPTPNTKINLLWTDIDPATGRPQTSLYTYNIYRCSGAACSPTASIATGVTVQYYENTALTAGTVYGYAITRNDGTGESVKSPTVYATTIATDDNLIHFPNTDWEYLFGPLTENANGSVTSYDPFSWMATTERANTTTYSDYLPIVGPHVLSGTLTFTNGSPNVTGTGTFFLEQVNTADSPSPRGATYNKIHVYGTANIDSPTISSITSNTALVLSSNWTGTTQTNEQADTSNVNPGNSANNIFQVDTYYNNGHFYVTYLRTGDTTYLAKARKASDAYFSGTARLGRNRDPATQAAPRQSSMGMFFARYLDGRPEMFDWIYLVTDNFYGQWITNKLAWGEIDSVRDQGYVIWYATLLQKLAPAGTDNILVSDGTTTSANGTSTISGSTIKSTYKTRLETALPTIETWQTAWGSYPQGDQAFPSGEQAFPSVTSTLLTGIFLNALDYCARNTNLNSTATNSARKQLLRGAAFLGFVAYMPERIDNDPTHKWRGTKYFSEGGTWVNPQAARWKDNQGVLDVTGQIQSVRLQNAHSMASLAAAYSLSGQSVFKDQADEEGNAMFAEIGENTGATADGLKSDANAALAKLGYEAYLSSPRWLAGRLESPSSIGTPPTINAGSDITLTGGVNVAKPIATGGCTNAPCDDYWTLTHLPEGVGDARSTNLPYIAERTTLTPIFVNMEPGVYTARIIRFDNLGMVAIDDVNITVGAGQFLPTIAMGDTSYNYPVYLASGTTSKDLKVLAAAGASGAAESFTYLWSVPVKPKNASAPTVTNATSQVASVTGLTDGDYYAKVTVTGVTSGLARDGYVPLTIHRAGNAIPTLAQNTIPLVLAGINQVLPAGTIKTYAIPAIVDPKGYQYYAASGLPATGYQIDNDGDFAIRGTGTYLWTISTGSLGAAAPTVTDASTLTPGFGVSGTPLVNGNTYTVTLTYNDGKDDAIGTFTVSVQSGGTTIPVGIRGRITGSGRIVMRP